MTEYERRLQATFATHTADELRRLAADLPVARLRRTDPRRVAARRNAARMSVRLHLAAYLTMVVIVLTVWLAVGLTAGVVLLADLADPRRRAGPGRTRGAAATAGRPAVREPVGGRRPPRWNPAGSPFAGS